MANAHTYIQYTHAHAHTHTHRLAKGASRAHVVQTLQAVGGKLHRPVLVGAKLVPDVVMVDARDLNREEHSGTCAREET